ncbi:MAG: class I SAM-dependent methyltransferase [Verrucomicrobia bacterium]|nr:class I SAM-dependent methyltransferase [Verrucomicrobiota bacterium]
MNRNKVTQQCVKAANRQFYNAIAHCYEEVDGRRSPELHAWLRRKLGEIRQRSPGGRLLDIGTGSGLVPRCAEDVFAFRVGMDLSAKILAANRKVLGLAVSADGDNLPFDNHSFDVVTCFAALHHLCNFDMLVSEVARVLRPGGIFYSDHDMDASFSRRFRLPLSVYRRFHNASARYQKASPDVTQELYRLTECQEAGVDSPHLVELLEKAGFTVEASFHWFGLSPVFDKLLGNWQPGRGWAPLLSLTATQENHP